MASFPRLEVGKPLDGNVTCSLAASPGDGAGPGAGGAAGAAPAAGTGAAGTARGRRRGAWPGSRLVGLPLSGLRKGVGTLKSLRFQVVGFAFNSERAAAVVRRHITGQRGDSTRAHVLICTYMFTYTCVAIPGGSLLLQNFSGNPQTVSCKRGWV